ncbi:family 20 glycosylhydrolase [Candidatus Latescibacterota bacterium]
MDLYPRPQYLHETGGEYRSGPEVTVLAVDPSCAGLAQQLVGQLARQLAGQQGCAARQVEAGPADICVGALNESGRELLRTRGVQARSEAARAEGYVLHAGDDGIALAGSDVAGTYYGVQTLHQAVRLDGGVLCMDKAEIQDWPYKAVRGVHLYMPGRGQIPFFKQLVTWLSSLKYNTMYLEVAGGMELERHPAINEAWVKFCETAATYPGGQRGIQDSQPWVKDSTHTELGQGGFLSKDEVAGLVAWARHHHVEVIPEVQTLSHAYYLCLAYPEIAERQDDPFPDTYCPSNPRTYEILFDVLDEVIEVFSPRLIHIGLDEIINLGHCPRCRGKSGAELLAGNINRIHEYLAARGIRTGMWGDKLLPLATGGRFGGGMAMDDSNSYWGRANTIPATYEALGMIPRDIQITNWYWSIDPEASRVFVREGLEVVLGNFGGNFAAQKLDRWHEVGAPEGILGAEVSTWCEVSDFAFGYNGSFFNMIFAAQMLWWSQYRDLDREAVTAAAARQTARLRQFLSDQPPLSQVEEGEAVDLPSGTDEDEMLPGFLPEGSAAVDAAHPTRGVPLEGSVRRLQFIHGCETSKQRRATWLLLDPTAFPEENLLALYVVRYGDGVEEEIPIYFGSHVGAWDVPYGEAIDAVPFLADPVPAGRDAAGRRITLYRYEWINPRPAAEVVSLRLEYRGDEEGAVWLTDLRRY